ncbi:MAG: HAD-IB family hydrolase [Mycobacterium sp.]
MEAIPDIPAEILAGPTGARVGAFFDLDGTLVQGFTAAVHLGHRIRHRQARLGELTGTLEAALRYRFGRMRFEHLLSRAGGYLRGESLDELHELGSRLYVQRIESRVHAEMRDVVAAHRQAGHTLVMCSSAMTMHAAPIAAALAIPHVICNRFDVDADGRLTGAIIRPIIWGRRKAQAVTDFCAANDVELQHSYFYADGAEDLPLMLEVGNPRPVNPRPGLAAAATEHGWPVLRVGRPARRRSGNGRASG